MNNFMDGFWEGIRSIGNLNPEVPETTLADAWQDVAQAFYDTGESMRTAIRKFDAQQKIS
ncbi:hypothetical protein FACS1894172_21830 [Spirochaetia bacterium]|nr:hypothetical protein FACS1894172_21830 [Spirochaetia bacterium]